MKSAHPHLVLVSPAEGGGTENETGVAQKDLVRDSQSWSKLWRAALVPILVLAGGCSDGGVGGAAAQLAASASDADLDSGSDSDSRLGEVAETAVTSGRTVSDLVRASDITEIGLTVNISDGFMSPGLSETFRLRLAAAGEKPYPQDGGPTEFGGHLFHDKGDAIQISKSAALAIVTAIRDAPFHTNDAFCSPFWAIDGKPYPPYISVTTIAAEYMFTVSDATCASSDHSRKGNAVSCVTYSALHSAMASAGGVVSTPKCEEYW